MRAYGLDVLIVLVAAVAAFEVMLRDGDDLRGPETSLWFAVPATVIMVSSLLARHWFPTGAPAACWLLAALASVVDGGLVPSSASMSVAGFGAAFLLGGVRDVVRSRLGLAIVVGSAVTIASNDPTMAPSDLVFTPLLFVVGWLVGYTIRQRADQVEAADVRVSQAEREREAAARVAVAEERARIARELHDIVAHSVSVMVLQVGAVRHRLTELRPEDREALEGVERTGRTALAEMRRLLGAMRREGDGLALAPQPGISDLDDLVAQVGRAGLRVRLHVEGEPCPLPQAVDVSAYRIVQEGLTNALKHAHAEHADVTVRYGTDDVRIEVRDDGTGAVPHGGEGFGLVGVRERVTIFGGEMRAGTATGGGFAVSARLPLRGLDA